MLLNICNLQVKQSIAPFLANNSTNVPLVNMKNLGVTKNYVFNI
jgi:hypothetical protein